MPDLSASGRVDMLTRQVAAVRGAVATGALSQRVHWVKSKHDIYLIRGSVGGELELYFYPSAGELKKKNDKKSQRGTPPRKQI